MTVLDHVHRFADLRVLVVGEAMLDSYMGGTCGRLCREAPVPIVAMTGRNDAPGGAANTAAVARALGANVDFVSVVGQDEGGGVLRSLLEGMGVGTGALLTVPARETLVKQRILGNDQLLLRLDRGSEGPIDAVSEHRLCEAIAAGWAKADAVIVSDYGYGVLTDAVVALVTRLQGEQPRVLGIDTKHAARWAGAKPTFAKPNYAEALALIDAQPVPPAQRPAQLKTAAGDLLDITGAQIVAATLDVAGAIVFERRAPEYRTFAKPVPHDRSAGAGDTFVAAFALALAGGAPTAAAADIAAAAAAVSVRARGTSLCSAAALHASLAGTDKLLARRDALDTIAAQRAAGGRIVFTNGCFDIVHHGHVTYLNRAKAMGDLLVVGLNSDASVRRLKGASRPINPEADRAGVLAGLSSVDLVMPFEEDSPSALIEAIAPHVFVKGGDYTLETLPEAPLVQRLGGEVRLLEFLEDRSTSGIVERIRAVTPQRETA